MKILLVLFLACPFLAQATGYYISSSTGTDISGNGLNGSNPLKTIAYFNAHFSPQPGDTVYLKSGDVFNEALNLLFRGSSTSHLVYTTYGGSGRVVINGFYMLAGGTQIGTSNVWEFYCPSLNRNTNMLVMDGIPQPMGRWPDAGFRTYTRANGDTLFDATLPASPNWTGAFVVAQTEHYIIDTALITSQPSGEIIADKAFSATNTTRGDGYFIENDPRTLQMTTITGRWYNNYTKDSMQVYLPGGLGSHVLQVPVIDSLIYFNRHGYVDVYNLDLEGSYNASVDMNFDTAFTMTNCLVRYGASNGISGNQSLQASFVNDTLNYFQNNGVQQTGSNTVHGLFKNVLINHCGLIPGMGASSGGNGTASYTGCNWPWGFSTFQNTTVLNSGYTGLAFGGDSVNLTNCVVDTFCSVKIDGGGYYTTDLSFISYTYGRHLTNCMALFGQNITSGVPLDTTDASMGFYLDSHSQAVTLTGCTGAYNVSGGLFIHGSHDTSYGSNYFGNGYAQHFVSEASGITITGLSLKKDQVSTSASGQLLSAFSTLASDLNTFGTVDSNYYAKTDTMDFHLSSATISTRTVSFPTWQALTGYDTHSTFLSVPTTFAYNTSSVSGAETFPMSNLAGTNYNGSVTVPAFGSLILYLLSP
jgi:hypothetical protein